MASASTPHGVEHGEMVHPGANSAGNPLRLGETVSPWTRHQEHAHRLSACPEQPSVRGYPMGESVPHALACGLSLAMMKLWMMTTIRLVFTLNLTLAHTNLVWLTQTWLGDTRNGYHAATGMRHLTSLCLLSCQGTESWAFHNNPLWTGGLSDLIPKCIWLKCRTSEVTEVWR